MFWLMLKDLPCFNAKIKVGEVNKYKRREAIKLLNSCHPTVTITT